MRSFEHILEAQPYKTTALRSLASGHTVMKLGRLSDFCNKKSFPCGIFQSNSGRGKTKVILKKEVQGGHSGPKVKKKTIRSK